MRRPGRLAHAIRPGRSFSRKPLRAYFFGCSAGGIAAGAAAEPSAGGVAPAAGAAAPVSAGAIVPPAAGAAPWSAGAAGAAGAAAGAGGVAALSGPAASCFAQAVSISAATIALRASLVFIDQYPEGSKSCVDETVAVLTAVPGPGSRATGKVNSIEVAVRLETSAAAASSSCRADTPCCRPDTTRSLTAADWRCV